VESKKVLERFGTSIIDIDLDGALKATEDALELGISPQKLMGEINKASNIVGEKWEAGEYFVAELIAAGAVMKSITEKLKPQLVSRKIKYKGKVLIGSAPGDLHDIGKNLAALCLNSAGFNVIDLGIDVSPEKFVEAVKKENPDILGISGLISTTMLSVGKVIEALKAAGLREGVKIIIGGAPVTEDYVNSIGADAFAIDAVYGVKVCEGWTARSP
jgi:methylmalonyl-CoA mutase cobalamin-binding domain/chain